MERSGTLGKQATIRGVLKGRERNGGPFWLPRANSVIDYLRFWRWILEMRDNTQFRVPRVLSGRFTLRTPKLGFRSQSLAPPQALCFGRLRGNNPDP